MAPELINRRTVISSSFLASMRLDTMPKEFQVHIFFQISSQIGWFLTACVTQGAVKEGKEQILGKVLIAQ